MKLEVTKKEMKGKAENKERERIKTELLMIKKIIYVIMIRFNVGINFSRGNFFNNF
jgi:hypothetical protein